MWNGGEGSALCKDGSAFPTAWFCDAKETTDGESRKALWLECWLGRNAEGGNPATFLAAGWFSSWDGFLGFVDASAKEADRTNFSGTIDGPIFNGRDYNRPGEGNTCRHDEIKDFAQIVFKMGHYI